MCWNRDERSSSPEAGIGRTNRLPASAERCSSTCGATGSGASSSTIEWANACPATEAGSSTARSSREMRSSRADISAWIVGGTSIAAPGASPIIATICSANSGLPSAASTTFASVSAGTPASASRATIWRTASSPSGASWIVRRVRMVAPALALVQQLGAGGAEDHHRALDRPREVLDQVEQRRLGPVQVVDHQHQRLVGGERLQQPADAPEHLLDRERGVGQADHRLQAGGDGAASGQRLDLGPRLVRRIRLVDVGGDADRVGHRPERDAVAVRQAAARHDAGRRLDRGEELRGQPRLADSRLAEQRHQPRPAVGDGAVELREQLGVLLVAADHRRQPPGAGAHAGVLQHGDQPVGADALRLALELQRLDLLDRDHVGHQPVGQLAQQHLLGRCRLLQPGGDVDGVAGDQPLVGRRVAGDHLAGVDAGAVLERDAPARLEVGVQRLQRGLHVGRRAHRPQRVVLVQPRQAEHRHHRVADELLDAAAVPLEHRPHGVEVLGHHGAQSLGVQLLAEAGRALEVGEHDGHRLARLLRRQRLLERRSAETAQPEPVGVLLTAVGADPHWRECTGEARHNVGDLTNRDPLGWVPRRDNRQGVRPCEHSHAAGVG